MMIEIEIAAALMMMPAQAVVYLMEIDCWGLYGNDVLSQYLGPSKSLLERRNLGRVVANLAGYFGSDFGRNFVYRYMD